MKAVEFIKKRGWNMAKIHLDVMDAENWHNGFYDDLKSLVESWEFVQSYSGLAMAKRQYSCFANACASVGVNQSPRVIALGKAIADVESVELS